jgi:superfamily II DNA or RNA helicase
VGLSATPLARGDKKSVYAVAALGPVIYRVKNDVLQAAGLLAVPTIRFKTVHQRPITRFDPLSGKDLPEEDWHKVYSIGIVGSATRNQAIVEATKVAEKPCLVFVKEIEHGKALTKLLIAAGLQTDFIWGTHGQGSRKNAIKSLLRGATDVLVCSSIFQEGVDIPELRSVVIASGGKSVISALQKIGRGMRPTKGKTTFEVYDFLDKGHPWLERQSRARFNAFKNEGHETLLLTP